MSESLTPAQVAEYLGFKTSSIYALISRNELAATKVGRNRLISPAQLQDYMNRRGTNRDIDCRYAPSNLAS